MQKKQRSFNKYSTYLSLLILLVCCDTASAQEVDPTKVTTKDTSLAHLYHANVHLGVSSQKALFAGYRLVIDPIFFGVDFGYQVYSPEKLYAFSATMGYVPVATRTEPGFVYALIFTNQWKEFFSDSKETSYTILTANLGWLSQHGVGLSYGLNLGAGVKMTGSMSRAGDGKVLHDAVPFINLEGSVGFTFF